jgi:polysaccharide export outer membrane protein
LQDDFSELQSQTPKVTIKAGDILYINAITGNPEIDKNLAISNNNSSSTANESTYFLQGYIVSDSGTIQMPFVGNIRVVGFTTEQAEVHIQKELKKIIKNPNVSVRLLSYTITVLGEVKNPGSYTIYKKEINIIEFLGMAGDVTDLGNRTNIEVLRKTDAGYKRIVIDLSNSIAITSAGFYLLPGDVVIVKPLKTKTLRQNIPIISFGFATLSSVLLVLNLFK